MFVSGAVKRNNFLIFCIGIFLSAILLSWPTDSFGAKLNFPDEPARNSFVVDEINLLSDADKYQVNEIAKTLLKEERIALFVVAIDSLEEYDADFLSIESYARELFNSWEIGYDHRNYGMLLLISKSDRKARIELGADWGHTHDSQAQYIMNKLIIPRFKDGYFSGGVVEGVKGMDAMGRGLALPSPYYQWWVIPSLATAAFVLIICSISLIRSGRNGVGWLLLTAAFFIIMFILKTIYESVFSDSAYGAGGGGFSGGGGASGGW